MLSDGGRLLSTEGAIVPKKLPACSREYRRPWRLSRLELVKSALGGVSLPALLGGVGSWRRALAYRAALLFVVYTRGHFLVRRAKILYSDNQNTSEKIQHIS